jgi:hypothetical protein
MVGVRVGVFVELMLITELVKLLYYWRVTFLESDFCYLRDNQLVNLLEYMKFFS